MTQNKAFTDHKNVVDEISKQWAIALAEVLALRAENYRLRSALDPFANAGLTMATRLERGVKKESDLVELHFAGKGSYITTIYAEDLKRASEALKKPAQAKPDA